MEQNLEFFYDQTHTGEKPWHYISCENWCREECILLSSVWKQFERQSLHQNTHTEEKPYHCQVCAKCFTKSLHERTHTGKNPFRFQVCENSLRDNLYIKTLTQKRNHIFVKCVESVSHRHKHIYKMRDKKSRTRLTQSIDKANRTLEKNNMIAEIFILISSVSV